MSDSGQFTQEGVHERRKMFPLRVRSTRDGLGSPWPWDRHLCITSSKWIAFCRFTIGYEQEPTRENAFVFCQSNGITVGWEGKVTNNIMKRKRTCVHLDLLPGLVLTSAEKLFFFSLPFSQVSRGIVWACLSVTGKIHLSTTRCIEGYSCHFLPGETSTAGVKVPTSDAAQHDCHMDHFGNSWQPCV